MTLRVYWRILGLDKNERIGVRSIQRALGLSSPSVASHHLEKLKTLGLLEKDATGEYRLRSEEHTSELQSRPHLVCRLLLEKKKLVSPSQLQVSSRAVLYVKPRQR